MAYTDNKSNNKNKPKEKTVAPIKVEKINTSENSKKEVLAIIIGILVIAALITGSVIYFRSDGGELTKPNKKRDDIVDVKPENKPGKKNNKKSEYSNEYRLIPVKASTKSSIDDDDEDEDEDDYTPTVNVVKKECVNECPSIKVVSVNDNTSDAFNKATKVRHVTARDAMENVTATETVDFLSKNTTNSKTYYYTNNANVYRIEITGNLNTTKNDLDLLAKASVQAATNKEVSKAKTKLKTKVNTKNYNADATVNNTVREKVLKSAEKQLEDKMTMNDTNGMIVVSGPDSESITHATTIRIEAGAGNTINWAKGVTVRYDAKNDDDTITTVVKKYDERSLNAGDVTNYTYQDTTGINIVVGVEDGKNQEVRFDVSYVTNDGTSDSEHNEQYTVDMTQAILNYREDDGILSTAEQVVTEAESDAKENKIKSVIEETVPDSAAVDSIAELVNEAEEKIETKIEAAVIDENTSEDDIDIALTDNTITEIDAYVSNDLN